MLETLSAVKTIDDGAELVESEGAASPGAQLRVDAPWDGYEQMKAADIVDRLVVADAAEKAVVRLYEMVQTRGAFETEETDPLWRVADGGLRHDRLNEPGPVAHLKEVDLAARPAVVQPALERDRLAVVSVGAGVGSGGGSPRNPQGFPAFDSCRPVRRAPRRGGLPCPGC